MNRGHNRETVFADADDRRAFLGLLARYQKRYPLRLYHYCLMTNHFHLLLQLAEPKQLSALMAGLLRSYVHHFHRRHGFVGHLWQGRFKSPAVEAERYALSCGRYIERNPREARLVDEPWQYPWSSCQAYASGEAGPLLAANPWYEALSPEPSTRQRLWRAFLLGDDAKEEVIRRRDWVEGEADFRQQLLQVRGRPQPRGRGRPCGRPSEGIIPQGVEVMELQ
jgi:putative transposase